MAAPAAAAAATATAADLDAFAWPFAFAPYAIQLELMRAVRRALDAGHCGVFESPTGTGKTLSVRLAGSSSSGRRDARPAQRPATD